MSYTFLIMLYRIGHTILKTSKILYKIILIDSYWKYNISQFQYFNILSKKEKRKKIKKERERKRNLTLLFKKIMIHIVTISDLNCKAYIFLY